MRNMAQIAEGSPGVQDDHNVDNRPYPLECLTENPHLAEGDFFNYAPYLNRPRLHSHRSLRNVINWMTATAAMKPQVIQKAYWLLNPGMPPTFMPSTPLRKPSGRKIAATIDSR